MDESVVSISPQILSFSNVNYRVGDLKVLSNISGSATSGRILAIMGQSGSGKTSLLEILANRELAGDQSGVVCIDGLKINKNHKGIMGFVRQDDHLLATDTVYEMLLTSAQFRCRNISEDEKKHRVKKVISQLDLESRTNTMIGDEFNRGLSGGEKRRVSISSELVHDCQVLFLDEPTSGLDSSTAENVMQCLVKLARSGKIVVCTIHQPNSDITALFDDIMLLSHGNCVYFGKWSECVYYFSINGFECPKYVNPTDFFLKVLGNENESAALISRSKSNQDYGDMKSDTFSSSPLVPLLKSEPFSSSLMMDTIDIEFATTMPYQIKILCERFFRQWHRNPVMFWSELIQYVFLALFAGGMYHSMSDNAVNGAFDRCSAIFFALTVLCFTPSFTVITVFESERWLFIRERQSRCYKVASYVIAKTVVTWPIEILLVIVFCAISYFMVGFQVSFAKFVVFVIIVGLFQLISETYGLLFAVMCPTATYAVLWMSLVLVVLLSLGGFLVRTTPIYFQWLRVINYFTYALSAATTNEFNGLQLKDTNGNFVSASPYIPPDMTNGLTIEENVFVLIGMLFLMRVGCYCCLLGLNSHTKANNK